jgi:hypothetical protein
MDQPLNLLDLIKLVNPKIALFTSYTFSVSWFDAKLLPVLRKAGCREIGVLVDADQAASSAEESLSDSVGIFYRLAPIRAPGGGVFHPKLAYLVGEEDHYLAVASGNLTPSGMTFQLENFDVVCLSREPEVFQAFTVFLTTLASQVMPNSPQAAQLLKDAANLVGPATLQAMPAEPRAYRPVFIDTLNVSAATTLTQAFRTRFDSASELVSLSPFHSPDGGPVLRLARSVGATTISIGLDPKKRVAPFDKALYRPLPLKSRFVLPKGDELERRLHAKVLVLKGETASLVMTGSVNATAQSMESLKNVEVSLARWSTKSPFTWVNIKPDDYAPTQNKHEFKARAQLYVDAFVDEEFFVTGVLTQHQPSSKTLFVSVLHGSEVLLKQTLTLASNSSFRVGPLVNPTLGGKALRILVEAGNLSSSAWLNVVGSLEHHPGEHNRQGMLGRVSQGEPSAEDWDTLIGLLQEDLLNQSSRPEKDFNDKKESSGAFNFPKRKNTKSRANGSSGLRRIEEHLAALNRLLHGPAEPEPEKNNSLPKVTFLRKTDKQLEKEVATASSGDNKIVETRTQSARLERYCEDIAAKLACDAQTPGASTLAQIAACRALHRSQKGLDGGDFKTVVVWLSRFAKFNFSDTARQELLPLTVALSCVTAAGKRASPDAELKAYPVLSALKQYVEQMANKKLDLEDWQAHAQAGLALMLFCGTTSAEKVAALAAASVLAVTQDIDVAMVRQLKRALAGEALGEEESFVFPGIQKTVERKRMQLPLLLKSMVTEHEVDHGGCPMCYGHFIAEERRELRLYRSLNHGCGKLVLYPADKTRMTKMLQEPAHV